MSIILLRGFSNSGKDFVGNILCENYGYKRYAFADSLKTMIADAFKCDISLLHTQNGKLQICESDEARRTYRQILINEAFRMRYIDPDIFAKHCCGEIIREVKIPEKIVITDWRYPNELDVIKSYFPNHDVIPVHVTRFMQINSPINDISEYQLMYRKDDYTLINNMDKTIYEDVYKLYTYINNYL
jgi:hypothetical protein